MGLVAALLPMVPALAGLAALAGWRRTTARAGVVAAAIVVAGGIALAYRAVTIGPVEALDGLVRVDALSGFMIVTIGLVASIATGHGVGFLEAEVSRGHSSQQAARSYGVLVGVFIAAMLVAVSTDNLGVMWVAVEATTIATAFLVGHRHTRAAVEASWKYVVIASVGVTVAFLGTVLLYFVSRHGGYATLSWSELMGQASLLDPAVTRTAVGMLVVGYGTKMGLAPLHTWLPDAHSQAPAPVSALMSGVLLSVALYALLRVKTVADLAVGPGFVRGLLLVGGLLSLAVAAVFLVAQRDYKRLLAYSSVEHMGLMAVAAAIGTPLAIAGLLLHMLGHGLAKAVAFCASGDLLVATGTTRIDGVSGILARRPTVGATFGLGLLALLALPPFSLFPSELAILRAGFAAGLNLVSIAAIVLLLVAFAAVLAHGQRMILGRGDDLPTPLHRSGAALSPLVLGLALTAVLGVWLGPLAPLLEAAAEVIAP